MNKNFTYFVSDNAVNEINNKLMQLGLYDRYGFIIECGRPCMYKLIGPGMLKKVAEFSSEYAMRDAIEIIAMFVQSL